MSSVSSGKRNWKCPECGSDIQLSMTQLDPIACDTCLSRMRGGSKAERTSDASVGPIGLWQALPETTKLAVVAIGFVLGLLLGLFTGYTLGRSQSPESSGHVRIEKQEEQEEVRPEPPGPGYRWVRGRERKDGTRGPGHWAKDPNYKGADAPKPKK
jgi:DNA-directed RNA polymerase subunit RPC12/RpoP